MPNKISEELNPSHIDLHALTRSKRFLGSEFLTWLWYKIEENDELTLFPRGSSAAVRMNLWIDDRIVTSASSGQLNLLRGGDPVNSAEAAVALLSGKTVRELKVGFNIHGVGEYRATLNASDLRPKGLVLPSFEQEDDEESAPAMIPLRVRQVEFFLRILDGIFALFIDDRTSPDWDNAMTRAINEWITSRSNWKTLH